MTTTNECPTIDLPPLDHLAGQLGDDERPSLVTDHVWLYADGPGAAEVEHENPDAGKWLMFVPRSDIDGTWAAVRLLTEQGWLGTGAKVSTRFSNPNAPSADHVVCMYVADWRNTADVRRLLVNLRAAGFDAGLRFKRTRETRARKYANRGDRVSLYTSSPGSDGFYTERTGERHWLDGTDDVAIVAAIEAGDR